jgi:hypothetical protein
MNGAARPRTRRVGCRPGRECFDAERDRPGDPSPPEVAATGTSAQLLLQTVHEAPVPAIVGCQTPSV